ncbi:MAG TPA: ABC transporter ATP-binding protein [Pararhizobium sp.]|nr:ABC transporter ATP-binding protein [Pararhizobium sp.]
MADIALEGLSKSFGAMVGVAHLDLEIADEEFMVFLGPSGCGKTTTMRMIAGLIEPTTGTVRIGGQVMNDVESRDRDVAMVFQSYALYPNMSIYENIRFPLRMRGIARNRHRELVRKAADMVELGDYLDRRPKELSGGQRQRAALARAIVRRPRVFLMDEPLSNLDAKLRISMRAQLKHVQRELRTTTVYVTHDQVEAMTLADRIAVMEKGRLQQVSTPNDIYGDPANSFVAGFIGSPAMNLIRGRADAGRFTAQNTSVDGIRLSGAREVVLGIRPEDISVCGAEQAHLTGRLYAIEPTGDLTMLGVDVGDRVIISVKADRDFTAEIDSPIGLRFDPDRLYFFDAGTGERIRER